jgi:Carboxypeptidase regulatory-like domain
MRLRPILLTLELVLLTLVLARPADAQVAGTVVDERERPVDGAVVELWDRAGRPVARGVTGREGRFSFDADSSATAAQVLVRRTGYQPLRAPVPAERPATLGLRLELASYALEPLVVQGGESCPVADDPRARAAWERARIRYRQPDSVDMRGYSSKYVGRVPSTAGQVLEGMRPAAHSHWAAGLRHSLARDQVLTSGYARRMTGVNMDPEFDGWSYVQLYRYPQHFSDDVFGRLHTLSVVAEDGADVTLRFCPRRTDQPEIEGTLVLTREGVLKEAEWIYRMPPRRRRRGVNAWPEERAGGRVVLRPDAPGDDRPLLLPMTSLYWRTTHHGDYYYSWEEFTEWQIAPAAS